MTLPTCVVVMGVSGSGKTTVGGALASRLGCPFYDADDYHPPANIEKMRRGTPLTDGDRAPWLITLNGLMADHAKRKKHAVLACSALKQSYRGELGRGLKREDIGFVHLSPSALDLQARLETRCKDGSHFMPPSLLQSQLETLEPDPDGMMAVFSPSSCERGQKSFPGAEEIVDKILAL